MNIQSLLEQLLGGAAAGVDRQDMDKYTKGAAVGSVLGLMLGTSTGRQIGGKLIKYGGIAAIGALAWKAYQEHQQSQAAPAATGAPAQPVAPAASTPAFEALPAPERELRSQALLKAMIAAAGADGQVDERERGMIRGELDRLQADEATVRWVDTELARRATPAEVAAAATSPEMAAEIYLASVLVADEANAAERTYLDALAQELRLAPDLKTTLEARALAAG